MKISFSVHLLLMTYWPLEWGTVTEVILLDITLRGSLLSASEQTCIMLTNAECNRSLIIS